MCQQDEETSAFWILEFKNISDLFPKFLALYFKTFIVYLGILGVLLKFSLDKNATPKLTFALSIFAFFCCTLLFVCILIAEIMARKLRRRRKVALVALGQDVDDEIFQGNGVGPQEQYDIIDNTFKNSLK